jgi:hypothetical protein
LPPLRSGKNFFMMKSLLGLSLAVACIVPCTQVALLATYTFTSGGTEVPPAANTTFGAFNRGSV